MQTKIPKFNDLGLLPAGVYACSIAQLQAAFGYNSRREYLISRLAQCIEIMKQHRLQGTLYIDGSFVTDKEEPGDIEVTLDAKTQPLAVRDKVLLFYIKQHIELKKIDVDWYPTLPDNADFTLFFQYAGEKTAALKRCDIKQPKGILRLTRW